MIKHIKVGFFPSEGSSVLHDHEDGRNLNTPESIKNNPHVVAVLPSGAIMLVDRSGKNKADISYTSLPRKTDPIGLVDWSAVQQDARIAIALLAPVDVQHIEALGDAIREIVGGVKPALHHLVGLDPNRFEATALDKITRGVFADTIRLLDGVSAVDLAKTLAGIAMDSVDAAQLVPEDNGSRLTSVSPISSEGSCSADVAHDADQRLIRAGDTPASQCFQFDSEEDRATFLQLNFPAAWADLPAVEEQTNAVVDHVLHTAEQGDFRPDRNTVVDAALDSANALGLEITPEQAHRVQLRVLERIADGELDQERDDKHAP